MTFNQTAIMWTIFFAILYFFLTPKVEIHSMYSLTSKPMQHLIDYGFSIEVIVSVWPLFFCNCQPLGQAAKLIHSLCICVSRPSFAAVSWFLPRVIWRHHYLLFWNLFEWVSIIFSCFSRIPCQLIFIQKGTLGNVSAESEVTVVCFIFSVHEEIPKM